MEKDLQTTLGLTYYPGTNYLGLGKKSDLVAIFFRIDLQRRKIETQQKYEADIENMGKHVEKVSWQY